MELKAYLHEYPDRQVVGCRDKESDYEGPTAEIYTDDRGWLWIVTDPYEGSVMLNIEALPMLRRALSRIAKYQGRTVSAQ